MKRLLSASLKKLLRSQQGFSYVEISLALGIMGVIGPIIVVSLYQMQNVTAQGSSKLTTEADSRTLLQWLTKDLRMAQTTDLIDGGPAVSCQAMAPDPCISVSWTDHYGDASSSHAASYALVGREVRRTYDGTTHTVARNVEVLELSLLNKLVTVSLTSESIEWPGTSKESTHFLYLRHT